MSSINILHWSKTPLVGSPLNISNATNEITGHISNVVVENDYPNKGFLFKEFTQPAYLHSNKDPVNQNFISHLISKANIIHIHNSIDLESLKKIQRINTNCVYIYQVHSPLKEGPLFYPEYQNIESILSKKLVVAQYQPRIYQTFEPVPNIIDQKPSLNLIKDSDKPRVMYSPTHNRGGRWNNKYSSVVTEVLESLDKIGAIEFIRATDVKPKNLFEIRKTCHISIDEISTGAFHQVSIESLLAGNVTVNFADFFSKKIFSVAIDAKDDIPFFSIGSSDFHESIVSLIGDFNLIRKWQKRSYDYSCKYLDRHRLVKFYTNRYEEVLR